jgi:hypothetical protein
MGQSLRDGDDKQFLEFNKERKHFMTGKPISKMNADEKLTNMEKAIDDGGSALYEGRVITNKSDLPSKSELAVTEDERETARSDIQARRKALDAEENRLRISEQSDVLLPDERSKVTAPSPPPAKPKTN